MSPICGASCGLEPKIRQALFDDFFRDTFGLFFGGGAIVESVGYYSLTKMDDRIRL